MAQKQACSNHFENIAEYECQPCAAFLCHDCARRVWAAGSFVYQCRACQATLRPLYATGVRHGVREPPAEGAAAYLSRLPEMLMFPVHRPVLFMILGLAVIAAPLYWAVVNNISGPLSLIGLLLVKSLEASLYFYWVHQTAHGIREVNPPDYLDIWNDLFAPAFRYLTALLPILLAIVWIGDEIGSMALAFLLIAAKPTMVFDFTGPAVLVIAGLLLLPLLTVIAVVSQSAPAVLNPRLWFQSLRVMKLGYLTATVVFYAVFAFELLVWVPLLLRVHAEHSIPVVSALVTVAMGYLPMALRARVLGGLIEPYMKRIAHEA